METQHGGPGNDECRSTQKKNGCESHWRDCSVRLRNRRFREAKTWSIRNLLAEAYARVPIRSLRAIESISFQTTGGKVMSLINLVTLAGSLAIAASVVAAFAALSRAFWRSRRTG
jgi:hypothetical protein